MLRSVVAVVLGVVVASVIVFVEEMIGHAVYTPPQLDPNDREAMRAAIEQMPLGAFLFVLLSYVVGSVTGGWLAAWLARRAPLVHALIVGAFLTAAGVANLVMIPQPLWFAIVTLLVFLPAACAVRR